MSERFVLQVVRGPLSSVLAAFVACAAATAQTQVKAVGWGMERFDTSWSSETFVGVTAGGYHSLARRADGTFATWGYFGSPETAPSLPVGVDYASVASGMGFAVALRTDGVAVGWPAASAPVQSMPLAGVAEVAAGSDFSVVRFASGAVWSMGSTNYNVHLVPTAPAGTSYVHAAAGSKHGLALRSDGVAIGWGYDAEGQASPPPAPPGRSYVELDGGIYHSLGRLDDGSVIAWGLSTWGLLNVPALPAGVTYVDVDAGGKHSLALRSDGQVVAWGNNWFGQCNVPALPPGMSYLQISAGGPYSTGDDGQSLALRSDGRVIGWGTNVFSQATTPSVPAGVDVVQLSKGSSTDSSYPSNAALLSDGNVITWGEPAWAYVPVPTLPAGLTYVEVAVGATGKLARRSDNTLVAWGDSFGAQAGNDFVEIAAGPYHRVARRSNGTLVLWGFSSLSQPAPALPAGVTYVEIEAFYFNLARRSDGVVVAWGPQNTYGQLNVPALPPGLQYTEVAAGTYHALARRSDGNVVAWGNNSFGQCNVPGLPFGVTYVEIAARDNFSAALRSDGVLRVWGTTAGTENVPLIGPGERYVGLEAGSYGLAARVEQPWSTYCTAKVNSLGCTPAISADGAPLASQSSGFTVSCTAVRNQTNGLLFYAVNGSSAAVPFQCGFRCMTGAIKRTPLRSSAGSSSPAIDCTGVFALDMNAYAAGAAGGSPDPALAQPGTQVRTQWWGRDSGFAPPCNTTLSDALEYTVAP